MKEEYLNTLAKQRGMLVDEILLARVNIANRLHVIGWEAKLAECCIQLKQVDSLLLELAKLKTKEDKDK